MEGKIAATLSESDRNSKKKYKKLVKKLTSSRGSSRSNLDLSDDDSFYEENSSASKISAEDEDLQKYVKDFRKKVQEKFNGSETNRNYKFPRLKSRLESDSEQSIQSLEFVLFYDLKKQNDDKPIDENDQLIELLYSIGKMEKQAIRDEVENPRSKLLLLLYEVVENKMARDKQHEIENLVKGDPNYEQKYHLVQNYNVDLIRRSLKSHDNQGRLNIKEKKAKIGVDNLKQKKKVPELGTYYLKDTKEPPKLINKAKRDQAMVQKVEDRGRAHSESEESLDVLKKGEQIIKNYIHHGQTSSSHATPNHNISVLTNKSNQAGVKSKTPTVNPKEHPPVMQQNQKLPMKTPIFNQIAKVGAAATRDPHASRESSRSNTSIISKEINSRQGSSKPTSTAAAADGSQKSGQNMQGLTRQAEERALHLRVSAANQPTKHTSSNIAALNIYINKATKGSSEVDSANLGDTKSQRQSSGSNQSSNHHNKLRNIRKVQGTTNKELDMKIGEVNARRENHPNIFKQNTTLGSNQPLLNAIQNKNVLTLTQNLLNKRSKND